MSVAKDLEYHTNLKSDHQPASLLTLTLIIIVKMRLSMRVLAYYQQRSTANVESTDGQRKTR